MNVDELGIAVAFSAGLFSFLSPCVLPLFPSYLSFITGMSITDLTAERTRAVRGRVLLHAIAFIAGFSIVFVALGASFSVLGQLPFLLSALALRPFLTLFRRYRPLLPLVERTAGALLVIVGVLVYTNYYQVLNGWALAFTPDWLLSRL